MKAAGLKAIDTVVSSTAVLIKSKSPTNPEMVDLIASRILGVISMFLLLSFVPYLIPRSCAKICPLPVQYSPYQSLRSNQNHTWEACAHDQCIGRRRLVGSEFHGGEEENSTSDG